jgi:hypothetical protein
MPVLYQPDAVIWLESVAALVFLKGLLESALAWRVFCLLCEEIRRRRVDNFFAAADRLAALDLPVLPVEAIEQEIRLARKPKA